MTAMSGSTLRVIHLAPHAGSSGVGDYADDFEAAVAPYLAEVIRFRHGGPRTESALGILRERRRLRELVAQLQAEHPGEPIVVHSELSGGAVVPFWATIGLAKDLPGVRLTATVHDAPRPVWFPFLTRWVSRGKVLNQAIHRPLHRVLTGFERRALRDVDLFVLTENGVTATRALGMGRSVTRARHVLPVVGSPSSDAPVKAASGRPWAVGLFGHVYTGKGFDLIPALRRALPEDLTLVVAGRGTEALAGMPGVEIRGAVEGPDERDFFSSIRVLLMPYTRPPVGGRPMLPASGAHLRAVVSGTPSVALRSVDTEHLGSEGLCELVDGGAVELAAAAADLAHDEAALDAISAKLEAWVTEVAASDDAAPFLEVWTR